MSDALRKSFFSEAKKLTLDNDDLPPSDHKIKEVFQFCEVHFQRSRHWIAKNRGIVSQEMESIFNKKIAELMNMPRDQFKLFQMKVSEFQQTFPHAENWFSWYLHPERATILFDACKKEKNNMLLLLSKNTNAQENVGRQIQHAAMKKKISVMEAVDNLFRFCNMLHKDCAAVRSAASPHRIINQFKASSQSKRKGLKKMFPNDGRAPDTSAQLLPRQNIFSGIIWLFTRSDGASRKNTCTVDVALEIMYNLEIKSRLQGGSLLESLPKQHLLRQCFRHLEKNNCSMAREVLEPLVMEELNPTTPANWWGDIGNAFQIFKSIFGCTIVATSFCDGCGQ